MENLTWDQVNAYLWAKQGFGKPRPSALEPADGLIGLYGFAPTCYLSALARNPDFQLEALDGALYAERRLARMRCLRNTLFLLPERWIPAAFQATKERCQADFRKLIQKSGVSERANLEAGDRICRALEGCSLTAGDIKNVTAFNEQRVERALSFIIALLCAQGRLVRASVRGGWKSNLFEYAVFEEWLPDVSLESVTPQQAQIDIARLYFEGYGPATTEDFRWWSGFTRSETESAIRLLGDELTPINVDGLNGEHLALTVEQDQLSTVPDVPPDGVALLPVWDAYLMAYKDRRRFVSDPLYDHVYDGGGNATSTVLLNGRVAGVWELEEHRERVLLKVAMFEPIGRSAWREITEHGTRIGAAIGANVVQLVRCAKPPLLGSAAKTRFRSPLKDCEGEIDS